ncbi:hypothetical protein KCU81_g2142, partial [Aureobasidium melanogenum]|uniref:Uncharacterized protein n=1 Tax=Aureobasidium melanogenum (strain CBS 110374) TaxID=1043003 RepID=A0A074VN32_AURM1
MSAEDLGTRELGQVRSQRLDELLTTLRLLHDPSSNSKLGVPALDKLLSTHTKPYDPTNFSTIPAPPIIEISSHVPKSGKTEFLYWVIASLVLGGGDGEVEGAEVGDAVDEVGDGLGTTSDHAGDDMEQPTEEHSTLDASAAAQTDAMTFQTEDQSDQPLHNSAQQTNPPSRHNKPTPKAIALLSTSLVNIPRLSQILLSHLLSRNPTLSLLEAQAKVHTALSHIHIYHPTSLPSLITTISSLPGYFLSPSNTSKERRLGAILISRPSAYFWEDKIAVAPTSASSTTGKLPALASTLKRVAVTLQAPVFYTTSHLSGPSASSTNTTTPSTLPSFLSLPPALPPPFATLPSLRLIISKLPVQGFNKDIDAETALRQRGARDAAVREAKFRVSVNQWGKEGSERDRNVGFELVIDGGGVRVI